MVARFRGTFVISWSQTELDGLPGSMAAGVCVGSTWGWTGHPTRVDDGRDVYVLENPKGVEETRERAARQIRRFLGNEITPSLIGDDAPTESSLFNSAITLTDGTETFVATVIETDDQHNPLLLFVGNLPKPNQDHWVVSSTLRMIQADMNEAANGTICFSPDTKISTPDGQRRVAELEEGDLILTKDNGPQAVRWIGTSDISGARLAAMPHLRPVRLSAHVLGPGEPDSDLVLSPDHRLLVKGAVAQCLFNTDEVLVAARDLINDDTVRPDYRCRGIRYVHLMLDAHQIVWANGVEVESFHPAGMSQDRIATAQRERLIESFPALRDSPRNYGEFVRRNLTRSEAAILTYGALSGH